MADPTPHPRRLGNFEVLQELGQGGMGVVFLARQPALERLAVLKRIRRELVEDDRMLERFQREARAAAAVHHHNVVAVYDCFPFRGDHYIAQEFVDGLDLRAVLDAIGRLDVDVAALIGLEIIRGLEEIHASGTIHRDLKPANILLGLHGAVKIADFGIALVWCADGLTLPGTMIGSIPYMSPEQMAGERVDYRSDLFAFGMLMYEMLVGAPAFVESREDSSDVVLQRMRKAQYQPPRRRVPAVPRALSRLISDCLKANPARRPTSAAHVRRFLERHLGGISSADAGAEIVSQLQRRGVLQRAGDRTVVQPQVRARRRRRRRRGWVAPATAAALLLLLGTTYMVGRASSRGAVDGEWPVQPRRERAPGAGPPVLPAVASPAQEVTARVASPEPRATEGGGALPLSTPGSPPVELAAASTAQPGKVRFGARPWARIRIDDGEPFYTPSAAFLPLAPGRHHVVFEHPDFETAGYTVDVTMGQEQVMHHDFEASSRP